MIARKAFFDTVRTAPFGGSLAPGQVQGMSLLIDVWEKSYQKQTPLTQFAYELATAKLETGHTMQPIHEYGNRAYFMKMYDKSGSRPKVAATLGNTDVGDGAKFCGRGYVQLTGRTNYRRATKRLRELGVINGLVDFERDPDLVMRPEYAIPILFVGMEEGWFTGRKLDDVIDEKIDGDEFEDFKRARAIINGKDRDKLIADYATGFLTALRAANDPSRPIAFPEAPKIELPKPGQPGAQKDLAPTFLGRVADLFKPKG